jgi:hypothetical protein
VELELRMNLLMVPQLKLVLELRVERSGVELRMPVHMQVQGQQVLGLRQERVRPILLRVRLIRGQWTNKLHLRRLRSQFRAINLGLKPFRILF